MCISVVKKNSTSGHESVVYGDVQQGGIQCSFADNSLRHFILCHGMCLHKGFLHQGRLNHISRGSLHFTHFILLISLGFSSLGKIWDFYLIIIKIVPPDFSEYFVVCTSESCYASISSLVLQGLKCFVLRGKELIYYSKKSDRNMQYCAKVLGRCEKCCKLRMLENDK